MAYKNLFVHVDSSSQCAARLGAAAALANAFEAHLMGLYVLTRPQVPAFIETQIPAEALTIQDRAMEELAAVAKDSFSATMERSGVSVDLRQERTWEAGLARAVLRHARYSDLAILGQADPDEASSSYLEMPEHVVLGAGRPVLVLPYTYRGQAIGERVVVAWDASREATRAVNDALPLLGRAREVEVVSINPEKGGADHGEEPGADIALHLARHGVNVEIEHLAAPNIGTSDALLSRLADRSADLLVMGAYGHSRVREIVLGGVTRQVLRHMTVPVLMSH